MPLVRSATQHIAWTPIKVRGVKRQARVGPLQRAVLTFDDSPLTDRTRVRIGQKRRPHLGTARALIELWKAQTPWIGAHKPRADLGGCVGTRGYADRIPSRAISKQLERPLIQRLAIRISIDGTVKF